jgi:hypothetical protein
LRCGNFAELFLYAFDLIGQVTYAHAYAFESDAERRGSAS